MVRFRIGTWLVTIGKVLQGTSDAAEPRDGFLGVESDRRLTLTKEIAVVVSTHARDRYAERTGRMLTGRTLTNELQGVWKHAVVSIEPPKWLARTPSAGESAQIYASIADMVFPLVPYEGEANCFVATTVLTPDGPPRRRHFGQKSDSRFARKRRSR